jgi:hypothetical protein
MSTMEGQLDHTSAPGVNFHHSLSIYHSAAPWALYFPCCLKKIATFVSGLKLFVIIQLHKEYAFKYTYLFLIPYLYQDI